MSTNGQGGTQVRYKRILLKLSGEILAGDKGSGIDPEVLNGLCREIREVSELGVEVGVVIGGGNIFRGVQAGAQGLDRVTGDYMGQA
jgi:uridylate kinase